MEAQFRDIPDALWDQIVPLMPVRQKSTLRGRPPVPDREVLAGIVYRLRTGCQWKALTKDFGSGSTCHARFHEWCAAGVFTEIFSKLLALAIIELEMRCPPEATPRAAELSPVRPLVDQFTTSATESPVPPSEESLAVYSRSAGGLTAAKGPANSHTAAPEEWRIPQYSHRNEGSRYPGCAFRRNR